MSAINQNHLYDGAVYKGHILNGIMPFNQLLFEHPTRLEVKYIDITDDDIIYSKVISLEYNRDDPISIFRLPFSSDSDPLSAYTDQHMMADDNLPSTYPLGIADVESYNNRIVVTYNVAPIKTNGTIYINYIYNHQILKQVPFIGKINSYYTNDFVIPEGYLPIQNMDYIHHILITYQPRYINVLVKKID